ncbi:hypothetical protein BDN72DRAFT_846378 [Pluteus cervinus]|uniref:Uncharacterized protein n=1 Tax=Pluteus cervinus TaxID=181527 RepID=A0ACD3AGD4_9AGAR|nr:hypothetical protein BDN72DRAFT_846378 [Pluteus cervinus]
MSAQARALRIPEILDLIFGYFAIEDEGLLIPKSFNCDSESVTDSSDSSDSGSDSGDSDSGSGSGDEESHSSSSSSSGSDTSDGLSHKRTHIFPKGGGSTLFSAALTCRQFTPSALRVLWKTMDSLDPLVSVLPLVADRGKQHLLAPQITPEAWANYDAYRNRIHVLILSKKSIESMTSEPRNRAVYATLFAMNRFRLPCLRILVIPRMNDSNWLTTCSPFLTSPRLQHIRIDLVASSHTFASFCSLLHHAADQPLHSLLINTNVYTTDLGLLITPALRLLQVGLGRKLSASKTLANLPLLRELHLRLAGDVEDKPLLLPSLKVLHLSGDINCIGGFLTSCQCNLDGVFIKLPDSWHPPDNPGPAPKMLISVISQKWQASIKHIELDCESFRKPQKDVWDDFFEMIRPLQDIPLLTFRILNSPFRFKTKDPILSIPAYFPHAQTVDLLWSRPASGLTFPRLRLLAEACPHLLHLGVTILPEAKQNKLPVLNHGLKTLNVLNSNAPAAAADIASTLDRIFPSLSKIKTSSVGLKHTKWKEVERMLELFQRARDRE